MPMPPGDYAWLFTPGSTWTDEHGNRAVVHVADGGVLDLPTGRVVACDPYIHLGTGDIEPFTVAVEPGRYRVEAAMTTLTRPGEPRSGRPHRRVAAARLVVRDEPTATWEPALCPGQDPAGLDEDEFYGYGVDAGTGCFYDASADAPFAEAREEDDDALWEAFDDSDGLGPLLVTSPGTGHTLAAFSTGWGDGSYPTWIGRSAAGEVTCFLTDFFVAPEPDGTA